MATIQTPSTQLETGQEIKDERLESLPDGGKSSVDKARALLELLEGAGLGHTNAIFQRDSDDEGSNDDDDVDYMEDDETFLSQKGDDELDEHEEELPLTKHEPISPTSVLLLEDVPLPEDIPLPEESRPSAPPDRRAPDVAERLELLPPTALEDEWALPDTSSKKGKKGKMKKRSKVNLEDDLPHKEMAGIEAVYPGPASDSSRFDAMQDYRSHMRHARSAGVAMGGVVCVPRASHSRVGSKIGERAENFRPYKTSSKEGAWAFSDSPGLFGREEPKQRSASSGQVMELYGTHQIVSLGDYRSI